MTAAAPWDGIVLHYLRAKDHQVPRLFRRVFAPDGRFEATWEVGPPFPPTPPAEGLQAVTEVFRRMGASSENVLTAVPLDSVAVHGDAMHCTWVVAMTMRHRPRGMVAWGTYRWTLAHCGTLASELRVCFQGTSTLSTEAMGPVLDGMAALPHPWCERGQLVRALRSLSHVEALQTWLERTALESALSPQSAA